MDDFKSISVKKGKNGVELKNPTTYPMIGKGFQGAVFQLNDEQCVKIYADSTDAQNEAEALKAVQGLSFAPKVFETGSNYIIMEYLKGPNLSTYLKEKGSIPESISHQIFWILKEMKRIGFTKLDHRLKHFIVTEQEVLKMIDLVNVNKKYPNQPHPIKMLQRLKQMGLLPSFLAYAKKWEPELHAEWERTIRFDKL